MRMVALRTRPKGGVVALFGLCTLVFALVPVSIGPQDLISLFSHRALAAEFHPPPPLRSISGVQVAVYTFPRPLGTDIPRPVAYRLASLGSYASGVTGAVTAGDYLGAYTPTRRRSYPTVDRRHKGDRLSPAFRPGQPGAGARTRPRTDAEWTALTTAPEGEIAESVAATPRIEAALPPEDGVWPRPAAAHFADLTVPTRLAGLYFGVNSLNAPHSPFEWAPAAIGADIPLPPERQADPDGQTIARKGEVRGRNKPSRSLAARLGLSKKQRAKAEKCLADAVYFEARGEPVRGQIAVAQVVMNRVFSPFYPDEVCAVVYQNADHRLACQFTFACDGIPEVVTEPDAWRRAVAIAKDTLDGKLWLPEIAKATHYHAYWVHPSWVHEMHKLYKLGVHTFYRPRAWGDGADEPAWGSAKLTAELVKKL